MARFHQWISQIVRRMPALAADAACADRAAWRVRAPSDPTQPLWLVPAYQRQRRSGDRLMPR